MSEDTWSAARRTRRAAIGGGLAAGLGAVGTALAGCGPAGGAPGQDGAGSTRAPVTIEYWTFWPQERIDIVLPLLPTFEQRTRYIKANISGSGDFRAKLRTTLAAGTPPDASIADVFSLALYADQRALLDLTPFIKRDRLNLARDYVLSGFEDWCGKTLTFPLDGWSYGMAYNKTMFRERGVPDPWDAQKGQWTWDDFVEALTRLTRDDVVGFQVDGHNLNRGYLPFIAANGGEYFDFDKMRYALDDPKTVEAMEWLHDLATRRRLMATPDQTAELNKATNNDPFAAGRLATIGDPSYRPRPAAMKAVGDRFEWDIVPYPRRRKGDPSYGLAQGNGDWAFVNGKHPDEGYEFARFMGGEEVQGALGQTRIVQPALKKPRQDANGFLKAPPKHMQVFNDIWEAGYYRCNSTWHYRDLELGPQLDGIVYAAFRGEKTMKDALAEANRLGNSQVEFKERCFKPNWKRR